MPVFGRLPITLRVPLLAALLMIAVAVIASQLVLSSLDRLQAARIRELAQLHVDSLSVALGPHVLREDVWEVYDTLVRAAGQSEGRRTVFSAVADTRGRVLAATDPRRAPVDAMLAALAEGAEAPEALSPPRQDARVKLLAPLVYQGRHVGDLLTELDLSDIVAERARTRRVLIYANVAVAAILALLGYAASRRMLAPVARVVSRMQGSDGVPEPIPAAEIPPGDTETARLLRTYNDMVAAMRARAEAERRLAERERFVSLGRLSASLAHEINNPLGGLLNAADTIRQYADRPEVVRKSADLLTRGLKHLRDVAKATLELNRLDRADRNLTREDCDDLRLLLGPEVRDRGQRLDWTTDLDDDFSAALPAAPVRQIALNLLLNATRAAGPAGRVGFRAAADGERLILVVRDSGPGLDPAARARLLGDGPAPPSGGVGLRMVHDLAAGLNGEIAIETGAGGTEIRVSLPLSGGASPGGAAGARAGTGAGTASGAAGRGPC